MDFELGIRGRLALVYLWLDTIWRMDRHMRAQRRLAA
jgi:hypothetical protein